MTPPHPYLLRAAQIAEMPGTDKTHFLNPEAQRNNKSLGDATGLQQIGFHIIDIAPGKRSCEHHCHYHEEECVYVLSGEATAYIGDTAYPIKAGDFLGYPAGGEAHSIVNTGNETLRCIVVGQRLAHDVADYTRLNKRLFRAQNMPWHLVDIEDIRLLDPAQHGKK